MATIPEVGPYVDDREHAQFEEIARDAFVAPREESEQYFESVGRDTVRVLRRGGRVVGGLVILPLGQFFGGRSIPMGGIATVATAAEARGGGAATALLKAALEEMHENGTPISALYPATLKLYRRVGYEQAGVVCTGTLDTEWFDTRYREREARRALPGDEAAIRTLYREWAQHHPGNLDRAEVNWRWLMTTRQQQPVPGYVVEGPGGIEGYAYLETARPEGKPSETRLRDWVATTPEAGLRLLTLMADLKTTRKRVLWRGGPVEPLITQLMENRYEFRDLIAWMLRIVNVPAALEARGYGPGVAGELHLEVRDDVLSQNQGRWVLTVENGAARAEPGGRGDVQIDVRGLAALYSGYHSPRNLVLARLASGDERALALAGSLFAGPLPWMRDGF